MLEILIPLAGLGVAIVGSVLIPIHALMKRNTAEHARVVERLDNVDETLGEVKAEVKEVHSKVDSALTMAQTNHERILNLE